MMSRDEKEVVTLVYNRFMDSEEETWNKFDDLLEYIGWMEDEYLITQAGIHSMAHCNGTLRCHQDHGEGGHCFAPYIYEAVIAILALYAETKSLHPNNRYILTYYIAMSEMGEIFV